MLFSTALTVALVARAVEGDAECVHGDWAGGHNPHCACHDLFFGTRCQHPVCLYGRLSNSTCRCDAGYNGPNCQFPDGSTIQLPHCIQGRWLRRWEKCACDADWEGERCSVPKCYNGGTPKENYCLCDSLHFGAHCSISKCENGMAVNGSCRCVRGFYGAFCEKATCRNGGVFSHARGRCRCPSTFHGLHCHLACVHGHVEGRECVCDADWAGVACDVCARAHLKSRIIGSSQECDDDEPFGRQFSPRANQLNRGSPVEREPSNARQEWISSGFLSTTAVILVGLGLFCASDALRRKTNAVGSEVVEAPLTPSSSVPSAAPARSPWSLYSLLSFTRLCSPPPAYQDLPECEETPPTYEDATKASELTPLSSSTRLSYAATVTTLPPRPPSAVKIV